MNIYKPELKFIIFNILHFLDDVDENGKQIQRTSYKKEHQLGAIKLKNLIKNDVFILLNKTGKTVESIEMSDLEQVKLNELKQSDKSTAIGERFGDSEICLDNRMIEALKYYHKEREHLPEVSEETLLSLEEILK